ncbi:MAG: type II secretion system protein [Phycisphaerales bacterium]|nr:MAG: type II secretion system protein [Phycisphaerales bacterium]
MRREHHSRAFTLAELLVTLVVTGILLSALATLAFALSRATCVEDDTALAQAQLRHGTLRLQDLIWNCRMICAIEGNALAIWQADTNQDGQINVNELVYLDSGDTGDTLQLCSFSSSSNPHVTFSSGTLSMTRSELMFGHNGVYTPLIPDAENVQVVCDVAPPLTRQVTTSFDLTDKGIVGQYQVNAALRAWAGHLLNETGDTLVSDDDE